MTGGFRARAEELQTAHKCGRTRDCAPLYSAADLNASGGDGGGGKHTQKQRQLRLAALAGCSNDSTAVLASGAWCLQRDPRAARAWVSLPNGQSHARPSMHAPADALILAVLMQLLSRPRPAHPRSLVDLGAGIGQYGRALLALDPRARYVGFDGAGDVEAYTDRFVSWADLSQPFELLPRASVADYVLSLEVHAS